MPYSLNGVGSLKVTPLLLAVRDVQYTPAGRTSGPCAPSVFILSMAAIVTSRTPCLDSLVSSALFPCFQTATRIFDNRISWWLSYIG
ncbi:uncharacterized protein BDW43DRAFT_233665 [Aspergillus alliaceus]|uniref:uncharacterized protein n=1 Tax=Petromyces alliaceus TaxID=209559 RepID=UPI0012A645A0|nr:uncharacterized protein BDW43DRAFT_233665 [Aspergillus alliaceus]KAB8227965.1 hypothetical protein BDW43DRAFT_233665 [Aspergillus alliaceus]